MGRRSINTTKSGKYMNPTDQARKYRTRPWYNQENMLRIARRDLNRYPDWRSCLLVDWTVTGKEARKKELKKNKKQRQLVRAAVLKGKDPSQIIEEMEKIDQMGKEF